MPEPAPPSRKRRSIPSFSEGISSPKGQASEDGKIRALCMIRGACAAKRALSWQDLHAVRSRKAVCGAFRMHSAHILPKPAHFGYTAAICCHGLPPGDAFREHFSIGKRTGTHRGRILPRQGTREHTARVYCHCQSGQERIRAQSCHRRTLGNAFREHFANRTASSCGQAYCLAIALVPHESDGLFVQAVLCA